MLGYMFGFNARLGRLHYFLASLGLGFAIVVLLVVMAVAAVAVPELAQAATRWSIVVAVGLFLWANTMLQAMRFRDIGWDPVCVLPAWFATMALDYVVATRFPDYALTPSHAGTIVGVLINLGMCIALLFFPTGGDDVPAPRSVRRGDKRPITSPSEARLARISGGDGSRRTF